jgi:hypothetical protein
MPGNTVSPASLPGVLGFMVLAVTVLFMALALNSLLPRPDWLWNLFPPAARKRESWNDVTSSGESPWLAR